MVNATNDLHSVVIRDLVIEGSARPEPPSDPNSARSYRSRENRGGIMFLSNGDGQMKSLELINITVQNCTFNGVFISGARGINISNCDFTENGSSVVPGPKLQHNLLLTHCTDINILDSRLDTSPYGSGVALGQSSDAQITNCEIARNAYYGILIQECSNILIRGNLIEANDRSGIMAEFLYRGSENLTVTSNILQYNNGHGVETYAVRKSKMPDNTYVGNSLAAEKISDEKFILMK
jgi:parallel beta-helix repeat protein